MVHRADYFYYYTYGSFVKYYLNIRCIGSVVSEDVCMDGVDRARGETTSNGQDNSRASGGNNASNGDNSSTSG